MSDTRAVKPSKCLCIHAIDGYETYMLDENTIAVRPIWIDAKKIAAPSMQTVLLCVEGKVIIGRNESVQPEKDPYYCSWDCWPDPCIQVENVTHWMPLPKPPMEDS